MNKRFFLFGIIFYVFIGVSVTAIKAATYQKPLSKINEIYSKYRSNLERTKTNIYTKSSKAQYATYLQYNSWVDPCVGVNGFALFYVNAEIPGSNETDKNYTGVVKLKAIEGNPNNSVKFCFADPSLYFLPDTTIIVDSILLDKGEGAVWIKNYEAEDIIVYGISQDSLKSTHPSVFTFDTCGSIPSRILLTGPGKINVDPEMSGRYRVRLVDASGKILTGSIVDTLVTVRAIEGIKNNSINMIDALSNLQSDSAVKCVLIGGQGNLFLTDVESESLTLIATHDYFGSDTIVVNVRPIDEVLYITPFSVSGTYGTQNVDKSVLAIAMKGDGNPNPNNNSSKVEFKISDILGTPSASISPTGQQTLVSGLASFTLRDTEADSGIIMKTICSGTPQLLPNWMFGEKTAYAFKQPGKAILMQNIGPTTVIVNDTSNLSIYAVDGLGTLDTTYNGWVKYEINDTNNSCKLMEYGTGKSLTLAHIQKGVAKIWVTNSEIEEINIEFVDAEAKYLNAYLGGNGPDQSIDISFESPGNSATRWTLETNGNQFLVHQLISGTIKAVDDSGRIDTTFNDTAIFTTSGFATPESTMIPIAKGIGTVEIKDDSVETSTICAKGAGLTKWENDISFITGNQAAYLVPILTEDIITNDSMQITFLAMTPQFIIDTTWNGTVSIDYTDPSNSSIDWNGTPDSIPIIKGSGHIKIVNSEVENIEIEMNYKNGLPAIPVASSTKLLHFKARLVSSLPDTAFVGGIQDTVIFEIVDINGNVTSHNAWLRVWHLEQYPDTSVIMDDSVHIINGIGYLKIEDSKPESVWVYASSSDSLIVQINELMGIVTFKAVGIETQPTIPIKFNLSNGCPNPFTNNILIHYAIPVTSKVSLKIYDITGRTVCTILNEKVKPGYYTINWDGTDNNHKQISNGIYFYKFETDNFKSTKKITLLK
ncbi:MAG: T9SS type A sorting domain-containing protein [bacterium]|nr:T9SS type A sorting domain-containing protein [bacterium]